MLVKDVQPGDIFETLFDGKPTGNFYQKSRKTVTMDTGSGTRYRCWKRFNQGEAFIHGENECCVLIQPIDIEGF